MLTQRAGSACHSIIAAAHRLSSRDRTKPNCQTQEPQNRAHPSPTTGRFINALQTSLRLVGHAHEASQAPQLTLPSRPHHLSKDALDTESLCLEKTFQTIESTSTRGSPLLLRGPVSAEAHGTAVSPSLTGPTFRTALQYTLTKQIQPPSTSKAHSRLAGVFKCQL